MLFFSILLSTVHRNNCCIWCVIQLIPTVRDSYLLVFHPPFVFTVAATRRIPHSVQRLVLGDHQDHQRDFFDDPLLQKLSNRAFRIHKRVTLREVICVHDRESCSLFDCKDCGTVTQRVQLSSRIVLYDFSVPTVGGLSLSLSLSLSLIR